MEGARELSSDEVIHHHRSSEPDLVENCPLRDPVSPEYRLLLLTIREEISAAISQNTNAKSALFYSRLNMVLILGTIVAMIATQWQ